MKSSIIIPTYNEEKYIRDCIESLLEQSNKDFEIIIVDDGSTDNTKKIVNSFKSKKIKLITGEHRGPGFSRNLGATKANNDILIFVDADMTFDKNYLKNLIIPIEENKKIIGTTHNYEIANNTKNKISALWGKIRVKEEEGYGNSVIFRAIRKSVFLRMGGFNPKYGYADDQTFWIEKGIKPYVAKNTICYHRNPETLKETFNQARWMGASWKERYFIFRIPILNIFFMILFKIYIPLMIWKKSGRNEFKKNFYSAKLNGYYAGLKKSLIMGINYR